MAVLQQACRRELLRFLAASPLALVAPGIVARAGGGQLDTANALISDPSQAINVFDFEPVMKAKVPPAHFGYMASGVDGEETLRANREAFRHFALRPRRLVDISRTDMALSLFGQRYDSPIIAAPTGANRAYHPEGELAVARACKAGNHPMVLSTVASTSIEDASAARGAPVWFQLYTTSNWEFARAMLKRVERTGTPAVMMTVDRAGGSRNQETFLRLRQQDSRDCSTCHGDWGMAARTARIPMLKGFDMRDVTMAAPDATWEVIKRIRDATSMKLMIKGILTAEDALLAIGHGVDGIVVSNHGGRSEDGGSGTIDLLPEILAAVNGRAPVIVDGGFRRGADIVKALCMGATAVQIGRPYLWGLGAFGQPGVERVLQLLRGEVLSLMKQMGAEDLKGLVPAMVRPV